MRKILLLTMLLLGLAACNTFEGIGSDLSAGASAIGNALS